MSRERDGSDDQSSGKSSRYHDHLVKLHDIPYSSNKDDIKQFLSPCRVVAVHFFDNTSTSSCDCFVDLESEVDVRDALKKTGLFLDKTYIEVCRATIYEYNFHIKHNGMVSWREPVIRMSGLPFSCTMADVQNFFDDIEIARNGIYITRDMADTALGDGFVAFINMDNAYKAIDICDRKRIQHRYIELFPSTYDEAKRRILNDARSNARQFVGEEDDDSKNNVSIISRNSGSRSRYRSRSASRGYRQREIKRRHSPSVSPPPQSRFPTRSSRQRSNNNYRRRSRSRSLVRLSSPRNEEHLVKVRGMPYTVVEDDIRKFFGSSCQPARIEILQDRRTKRPNGDAYLHFRTLDEVNEALTYDRKYMGNRYIELYFDSPRYLSLSNRRRKNDNISHCLSRSPSRSKMNRYSRSRSDSTY